MSAEGSLLSAEPWIPFRSEFDNLPFGKRRGGRALYGEKLSVTEHMANTLMGLISGAAGYWTASKAGQSY